MNCSLQGRSALVTGGGSGIGLACAQRLAADGAHVTICGRTRSKLESAVQLIAQSVHSVQSARSGQGPQRARAARMPATSGQDDRASAPQVQHVVADVTVEDDVAQAVAAAAKITGRLDILFACAGGSFHMGSITEADAPSVRATIELNLFGSFLCVKQAGRIMARQGEGSIVLMSSGAGHFPHRYLWAYGMSKSGIESLCEYAAEELGDHGVRVNTVQPGIIDDELMGPITSGGALLDDYLEQMPIRRLGTVQDVAEAVRFLAGDESAWITGICLPVDGGHHLRRGADYSLLFEDA